MMLEHCGENQAAMEEYYEQMDIIIQKMFKDSEYHKNKPENWLKKMQNLVGGHEYQHAHADQARPHSYRDGKTFPFVVTHGFGVNEFQLWLLPMNAKHGILHTFNMDALVMMRGDSRAVILFTLAAFASFLAATWNSSRSRTLASYMAINTISG